MLMFWKSALNSFEYQSTAKIWKKLKSTLIYMSPGFPIISQKETNIYI